MIYVYLTTAGGLALTGNRPGPNVLHWVVCRGQATTRHEPRVIR